MSEDEKAIRAMVNEWMDATKRGDLEAVLALMADDVLFITPGREPFGKEQFAADSQTMIGVQVDGTSDIQEIEIAGDWAWMRNYLTITITPPNSDPMHLSGYTLTILKKTGDGKWLLARDANFVGPDK